MTRFALLSLGVVVAGLCGCAGAQGNTSALNALVQRQLPFYADSFVFHLEEEVQVNMRTYSALDTFTLFDGSDGTVNIECSTRSACSRGLYTYVSSPTLSGRN